MILITSKKFIATAVVIAFIACIIGRLAILNQYKNFSKPRVEVISQPPQKYEREITHGDTSKKEVIFTFDGGGTIESGDAILNVLKKS